MDRQTRLFYEFGPFQLDAAERVLRRAGQTLPLTPKGVEILLALVEQRGRLVGKDELMDRVWADAFVEPANLTQTVSVLRKLLEDDSQTPRYIQTVPKRGYRFIADVREVTLEEEHVTVEEHVQATVTVKHEEAIAAAPLWRRLTRGWQPQRSAAISALAVFGLSGFGLATWLLVSGARHGAAFKPAQLRFVELVSERGREVGALAGGRFSPDGRFVAFAGDGDGQNIWVMQLNGSGRVRVTQEKWRDSSPVWAPDGERLAFVSNRGQQIGIWTVPFLGGAVELVKVLGDETLDSQGGPPLLQAWAKDGQSLYYEWNHNFFRLDLRSREVAQLTRYDARTQRPRRFALAPDEQWLAFVDSRDGQSDIWRLELRTGAVTRVTADAARDRNPVWHPDGQRLIYNSVRDGRRQLYQIDVAGGAPLPLAASDHDSSVADVAPDGGKILCYSQRDESDLFAVTVATGAERQLTGALGVEFWPSVAPDGATLAFQTIPGERLDWDPRQGALFTRSLTAPAAEAPRRLTADGFAAQWAPDGARVAFLRWTGKSYGLWLVPAEGGAERSLVAEGVIYAGQTGGLPYNRLQTADYSWSPDGAQLAYCARPDGKANVWVVAADGARATSLTANTDSQWSVNCPLWSPRGDQLAFVSTSGAPPAPRRQSWALWRWQQGRAEIIYQSESITRLLGWSADDQLVIALAANSDLNQALPAELRIMVISTTGAAPRAAGVIPAAYLASTHLSPDRRNISGVKSQEGRENIWLLPLDGGPARQVSANTDEKLRYAGLVWSPDSKTIYCGKQAKWNLLTLIENHH